jgi:hypothetical protein
MMLSLALEKQNVFLNKSDATDWMGSFQK